MKTINAITHYLFAAVLLLFANSAWSQQTKIQNLRPYDRSGLNVFETPKTDTIRWTGFKARIGISSSFTFQDLNHENIVDTNQFTGDLSGWNLVDADKNNKDDRQLL